MGAERRPDTGLAMRLTRVLGGVVWSVFAMGLVAAAAVTVADVGEAAQEVLLVLLGFFFVAVVLCLAAAAVAYPSRRTALATLTVGVCLWAVGSAMLTSGSSLNDTTFPAPGEALFLASSLFMATFLLLDVPRRTSHAGTIWLETAVVCGGAATVAGFLLLKPVAVAFGSEGVPLLLGLLYPVLDLMLATLVLGQAVLRLRPRSRPTVSLAVGFVALAVADSSLALNLRTATYVSNVVIDIFYGIAFTLICSAACARRADVAQSQVRRQRAGTLIAAATIALAALAFRPSGGADWYITVPALVTLVAAGWRLVLALREAQGAAEALRLSRTDELTGLPNRRAVLQDLQAGLFDGRPLALMLLDLDGFKDINDSLGHAAGDAVLEAAADRMRRFVRPDLTVARLGGDEFAVLVRMSDQIELVELAQTPSAGAARAVARRGPRARHPRIHRHHGQG